MAKVLLVSEGYSIGGTSRVMSRLSQIFIDGGLEVDILVPNYRVNEAYSLAAECNLYYVAKDEKVKSKFLLGVDLIVFWKDLIKIARTAKYDYIISFWNYVNLLLIVTPLPKLSKKIICSHISFTSLKIHWKILTRIIYPFADSVVVLNKREQEIYSEFCPKVTVIENPLPIL
jgi:hypothetical protein